MWTWIFQIELGEEWSQKSIEAWNTRCIDASVIMRSSDGKHGLDWNFQHLQIDQRLESSAFEVEWWSNALLGKAK